MIKSPIKANYGANGKIKKLFYYQTEIRNNDQAYLFTKSKKLIHVRDIFKDNTGKILIQGDELIGYHRHHELLAYSFVQTLPLSEPVYFKDFILSEVGHLYIFDNISYIFFSHDVQFL